MGVIKKNTMTIKRISKPKKKNIDLMLAYISRLEKKSQENQKNKI
tara:strand:+ start:619 stop:753 length:135 start_codon:yes stop_codon:yes gene_type:complete